MFYDDLRKMDELLKETNMGSKELKVVSEQPHMDEDIYGLRRQIEARENVKDYIRTEILRLQGLMETLTHEVIQLDLRLRERKPTGEPRNKRYLYSPAEVMNPRLTDGAGNSVDAEVVE